MDSAKEPDIQQRLPLPAGEQIGVSSGEHGAASETTGSPGQLHICFHCTGELVYPLDWSEEGPRHWRIVLRCPECESRREGVFDQPAVEGLDTELHRGPGPLSADLPRAHPAHMA